MAYELPALPYAYDALEPHIDARTMEIHHTKHHQAYINNVNAALEGTALEGVAVNELITRLDELPEDKQTAVRNNGGGHANHSLFWEIMSPNGGEPTGELLAAINDSLGGYDSFKEQFSKAAATRFGSGWAWLVKKADGSLAITTTANADNPMRGGAIPILTCDVWEHAYYIDFRNARAKYLQDFWGWVNWEFVESNL